MCFGYSTYNRRFDYDSGSDTWEVGGTAMSQGIAWFEGNLEVGSGTYYSTFIATGNISTAGSHRNYASNYVGYSGSAEGINHAPRGICTNGISVYVPAQLCVDGAYNPEGSGGLGNYAYMAGSVQEDDAYYGGNIELGASTNARGSVLAGNEFHSGGSTTIHGYIAAWGGGDITFNSMGGSTTIEVEYIPPTYTPGDGTELYEPGRGGGAIEANVRVLWTRYL